MLITNQWIIEFQLTAQRNLLRRHATLPNEGRETAADDGDRQRAVLGHHPCLPAVHVQETSHRGGHRRARGWVDHIVRRTV